MNKTVFLVTLLCAFQNAHILAQTNKIPNLSQLHVGIGYMPILRFKPTTFDYTPNNLKQATIGLNYGSGYIKYRFQYAFIEPTNTFYPDCRIFDNSLGYTHFVKLFNGGYLFAGAQVGLNTFYMDVSGSSLSANRSLETEMSSGIELGLEVRLKNKLGFVAAFKQQRIFALPRNDLSMIDLGMVYYFGSNAKLKKWLE
jgi:hypothetical protein